jgi:PhnB protein
MKDRIEPNIELGPLVVQLAVADADAAIDFYIRAFGASELYRNRETATGGRVVHCELLIAGARVVVHDEFPEYGLLAPPSLGGTAVSLNLYVADVDETYAQAIAAGGQMIVPPTNRFWGARSGALYDPFGHRWVISTQFDDPAPEDIIRLSNEAPTEIRLSAAAKARAVRPDAPGRGGEED